MTRDPSHENYDGDLWMKFGLFILGMTATGLMMDPLIEKALDWTSPTHRDYVGTVVRGLCGIVFLVVVWGLVQMRPKRDRRPAR